MSNTPSTIENLMKVTATVQRTDTTTEKSHGSLFEFIYGVGPSGITPFEKALFGKAVGDRIQFNIAHTDVCESMGHLEMPLREQTGIFAPVSMRVTITGIAKAEDREVVKAMASGGSCGDCGCGCGGH